jgi:sulfate adenylyltransferase subunit 1 (EFTu-like GTPase family)
MEKLVSGKRLLATLLLIVLAVPLTGYGYLLMGSLTVTTEEAVTVSDFTITLPTRCSGTDTFTGAITLDFSKGGFQVGDQVVVLTELVPTDVKIIQGFRYITVEVVDPATGNIVTTMTLTTPHGEFTVTTQDANADNVPDTQNYDLRVTWMTEPQRFRTLF